MKLSHISVPLHTSLNLWPRKTKQNIFNSVEVIACPYADENTNGWVYAAIPKMALE